METNLQRKYVVLLNGSKSVQVFIIVCWYVYYRWTCDYQEAHWNSTWNNSILAQSLMWDSI